MTPIEWTPNLEIGIDVIDGQHRRIVDYINRLQAASETADDAITSRVIGELIDYTYSHFAFEEALMEQAGYDSLPIHQRTHQAFCARVDDFRRRADHGEDIAAPLAELLRHWLLEHIQHDDASYADLVREKLPRLRETESGSWLSNALRRFFN
jgi:hemerythrin